jgi:cellulose synthase/poly-beta-1,6-N-acetylglucosamine synthase-like glycosyltransferase
MWIELLVFSYFVFAVSYSLTFSVAGLFYRIPSFLSVAGTHHHKMAVIIPAYKEDVVIINVAREALNQSYPKASYDVIIIADTLKDTTIAALKQLDVIVHEVKFERSTKVKSLQSVLNKYTEYEVAVILDADNIMQPDFLEKINKCYHNGWRAIQGRRMAKNRNTSFAILDGLSESIANHINRQGAAALGLSCPLIGSGMAFNFVLLRDIMNTIDSVVEDKELQIKLLEQQIKIHYLNNAIVLDEKIDNPEVFKNQRTRWMSGHYTHLRNDFVKGVKALFRGDFSIFNITVLFSIQLPRMMNLGVLGIVTMTAIVFHRWLYLPFWYWIVLLTLYGVSFALAIPASHYNKAFFKAILQLPKAFLIILAVHFKLKGADKKFIHTPHKQH